jgi:hypothetical protein
MPKPATGKWPRVQFMIHCHTCDVKIKLSIQYGASTIWSTSSASKLAEWAQHEGHDLEWRYEFYDGHDRSATQVG